MRLTEQVLGTEPVHGPGLALRHREPIEAEGRSDDGDLDALFVVKIVGRADSALVRAVPTWLDLGLIKIIEGPRESREALIDSSGWTVVQTS